jgi:phosphatidylglycerol:prolipoprotein diacylglycerol transferase
MGFQVGPLTIRYYGIIVMIGVIAAAWLASREARRRGLSSETVWDGLVWVLIGGIVGARLWHILTPPESMVAVGLTTRFYLTHPLDAIATWNGGLGIPGAVIGGLLALYWFARRRKLDYLVWLDIVAPALALGQAIGRWGITSTRKSTARLPTPWAITIDPDYRLPGFQDIERYHPLFSTIAVEFGVMGVLLWLGRRYPDRLIKEISS